MIMPVSLEILGGCEGGVRIIVTDETRQRFALVFFLLFHQPSLQHPLYLPSSSAFCFLRNLAPLSPTLLIPNFSLYPLQYPPHPTTIPPPPKPHTPQTPPPPPPHPPPPCTHNKLTRTDLYCRTSSSASVFCAISMTVSHSPRRSK
jgi:hypothetical protein